MRPAADGPWTGKPYFTRLWRRLYFSVIWLIIAVALAPFGTLILLELSGASYFQARRTLELVIPACVGLVLVGGVTIMVMNGMIVYRMWAALRDVDVDGRGPTRAHRHGSARMSPGLAVGLLFVPLFNIYWIFQVFVGWAHDYNHSAVGRRPGAPPVSKAHAIAMCLLVLAGMIPWLGLVAVLVNIFVGLSFFRRCMSAVNFIAKQPLDHRGPPAVASAAAAGSDDGPAMFPETYPPAANPAGRIAGGAGVVLLGFLFAIVKGGGLGLLENKSVSGEAKVVVAIVGLLLLVLIAWLYNFLSQPSHVPTRATPRRPAVPSADPAVAAYPTPPPAAAPVGVDWAPRPVGPPPVGPPPVVSPRVPPPPLVPPTPLPLARDVAPASQPLPPGGITRPVVPLAAPPKRPLPIDPTQETLPLEAPRSRQSGPPLAPPAASDPPIAPRRPAPWPSDDPLEIPHADPLTQPPPDPNMRVIRLAVVTAVAIIGVTGVLIVGILIGRWLTPSTADELLTINFGPGGFPVKTGQVEIPVSNTPPSPPVKPETPRWPFGEAQAAAHQKAWANYLGVPVRTTLDLGDGDVVEMVLVPPGTFQMGSPPAERDDVAKRFNVRAEWLADEMRHEVTLTKAVYLAKHELTVGQFRRFVQATGYQTDAERSGEGASAYTGDKWEINRSLTWQRPGFEQTAAHPVTCVNWNDATKFCEWASQRSGGTVRLPTEAEWEWGCRAGSAERYHFGNDEDTLARYGNLADLTVKEKFKWVNTINARDGYLYTAPVGSYRSNGFGLHDMHGNVWEWCGDWYAPHTANAATDPTGPTTGSDRVFRGGGWSDIACNCRAAYRSWLRPGYRNNLGFRIARVPSGAGK